MGLFREVCARVARGARAYIPLSKTVATAQSVLCRRYETVIVSCILCGDIVLGVHVRQSSFPFHVAIGCFFTICHPSPPLPPQPTALRSRLTNRPFALIHLPFSLSNGGILRW